MPLNKAMPHWSWRLALMLLLGLLFAAAACGGDSGDDAGPRLFLDGNTFDLGEVGAAQAVERSIEFRNEGDAPLRVSIAKVRPAPDADCGCGVEGFEVRPEVVQPGESGRLVFRLRAPQGMERMEDRMVAELESNDRSRPNLAITLVFEMGP